MKRTWRTGLLVLLTLIGAGLLFPLPPLSSPSGALAQTAPGGASGASEQAVAQEGPAVTVEVPPERLGTMGIRTAEAAVKPLRKTLRTVGRVEFDETRLTTVNLKVDGWVDKLHADYTGKYVEKGAPLAEIYSQELMSTQLEYINLLKWKPTLGLRSQRNMEFSLGDRFGPVGRLTIYDLDPMVEVVRQKLSLWEIPEETILKIEKSMQPVKTLTVKSPASGYIYQKPVFRGTRVTAGEKIFDIVDLSTVWVLADIYEYEIPFVKVGQNARITLSAYPRREFPAKVDFVYPSLSGQTRTAKARFVLPNPDLLLKPQMFADVELEVDLGERLAIPDTAVLDTGTRQIVYVDVGDGFFAPRQIKVGDRSDGMIEVLQGLKAGEKVASSAVFLIDSEAKLKGVNP